LSNFVQNDTYPQILSTYQQIVDKIIGFVAIYNPKGSLFTYFQGQIQRNVIQ